MFADKGWPVVLLDVDSKQSESALRGPPPAFVTEDFLKALRSIIHPRGVYVCTCMYCIYVLGYLVKCHSVYCLSFKNHYGNYSNGTTTQCSKMMFIPTILKSIVAPDIIQGAAFNQVKY